jgi:MoaA/NifB/PqqE/SkfB family radical SAM enzyme
MGLSETFCAAPWFQARIDWDGQYRPCCGLTEKDSEFKGQTQYSIKDATVDEWMSSEYSQYLRKNLTEGIQLKECDNCWQKEKHNVKSFRHDANNIVTKNQNSNLDNTWVKLFVDKNQNYQNYQIVSADVKLSNVCNFSCAMCSPHNSSKVYDRWQSNLNNKFVQERLLQQPTFLKDIAATYQSKRGYQHLKDILNHPLRYLKVLGGEPTLDKDLFRVLDQVPVEKKSKIHIELVTNGSQDLVEISKKLQDYKFVSYTISLEGIGDIQDYVRKGSHWPTVEQNILNAKRNGIHVNVVYTMQAMSILNLHELLKWCSDNQIPISFGILDYPGYLAVSVLPKNIREIISNNLYKSLYVNIINSQDNTNILSIDNIIELIDTIPDLSENYSKFLEYVAWFDQDSAQKLRDIQPILYTG